MMDWPFSTHTRTREGTTTSEWRRSVRTRMPLRIALMGVCSLEWMKKFREPGVDLLAVMGTEGAPLCTVVQFDSSTMGTTDAPEIFGGIPYEAHWGLGGRTIAGVLPRTATIGDMVIAIHDQAPFKGRLCLTMPGTEVPMSPVGASMGLGKYLIRHKLRGACIVTDAPASEPGIAQAIA